MLLCRYMRPMQSRTTSGWATGSPITGSRRLSRSSNLYHPGESPEQPVTMQCQDAPCKWKKRAHAGHHLSWAGMARACCVDVATEVVPVGPQNDCTQAEQLARQQDIVAIAQPGMMPGVLLFFEGLFRLWNAIKCYHMLSRDGAWMVDLHTTRRQSDCFILRCTASLLYFMYCCRAGPALLTHHQGFAGLQLLDLKVHEWRRLQVRWPAQLQIAALLSHGGGLCQQCRCQIDALLDIHHPIPVVVSSCAHLCMIQACLENLQPCQKYRATHLFLCGSSHLWV